MCKSIIGGFSSGGSSGIQSINGNTNPSQTIVGSGGTTVSSSNGTTTITSSGSSIPISLNNSWIPAFQGNNLSSTYITQTGTWSSISSICYVSFQIVVNNYQTVSGVTSMTLNLPIQSAVGNTQFFNGLIKQGSGSSFSTILVQFQISPSSSTCNLFLDFVLESDDLWQANFFYNTV